MKPKTIRRRKKIYVASQIKQLEALASPMGFQIRTTMEMIGACTVSELAEWMDCDSKSLYYHIKKMVKEGLVVRSGSKDAYRRQEAVYELAGSKIVIDQTISSRVFLQAVTKCATALLRYALRSFERTLLSGKFQRQGAHRCFRFNQMRSRLSQDSIRKLHKKLDELQQFLEEHDDPNSENSLVFTMALSPPDLRKANQNTVKNRRQNQVFESI